MVENLRQNRDFSKGPVWDATSTRWLIEIRYPDGSRLRRRFTRERDAWRAWTAEQSKIANGTWNAATPPRLTFGEALEKYRAHATVQVPSFSSYTAPALKVWEAGIPAAHHSQA